jgi:hypothetical protein
MARVKQHLPGDHIADPRHEVYEKLMAAGLREKIEPGARIAITAGSRGIAAFVGILNGVIDAVRTAGGDPFLIPAMGSHGGATSEGQMEILRRLGVTSETVPARVCGTMKTVALGKASNGAEAHVDRAAVEADGIIVMGRSKTHPESAAGLASGLLKMSTVGLGKQIGAQEAHSHGLWDSIREVPKLQLAKSKILFGVAMVENGHNQPKTIEVVPAFYDAFLDSDERLLEISKSYLATIPFGQLDVLVVDEIGKTISGTGMDLNVIGSWRAKGKGPAIPDFKRIVALSLTKGSLGNGLGIGLADFTTRRFLKEYDPQATYINLLTATEPGSTTREGVVPLALDSDREAIEVALYSALADGGARVCRIRSTRCLEEMQISEALVEEARLDPRLSIESEPAPLEFNAHGDLW